MKLIIGIYKKLKILMKLERKLPTVKEQYTITEIFPSKAMMKETMKCALK